MVYQVSDMSHFANVHHLEYLFNPLATKPIHGPKLVRAAQADAYVPLPEAELVAGYNVEY